MEQTRKIPAEAVDLYTRFIHGRTAQGLLFEALKAGHYREAERLRALYIPLEDLRDAISPVQVLHEAVTLASIADMGPLMPLFGNLNTEHHTAVRDAARRLAAADFEQAERAA